MGRKELNKIEVSRLEMNERTFSHLVLTVNNLIDHVKKQDEQIETLRRANQTRNEMEGEF